MNILIIASWYYSDAAPQRGSFIREQAHALVNAGHNVGVVVFDRDVNNALLTLNTQQDGDVTEYRIAVPAPWHRILGFYVPSIFVKQMTNAIAAFAPDIIHAHAVRPGATVLSKLDVDIPIVVTEHSSPITDFWWTAHGKRQITRAYEKAREVLCVGSVLQSELAQYFGVKHTRVMPNGIDTLKFPPSKLADKRDYFLVVSYLLKRKRVDDIVRAFAKLATERRLVILGDGPEKIALISLAETLGVSERIDFMGNVDRESVAQYLRQAHAFIHASEHETFGLVCAEAIASGTYVICSKCGGPEDFVKAPYGEFFEVGDVEMLAKQMQQIEQMTYTQAQINDAHAYIDDNYSLHALSQSLTSLYETLSKPNTSAVV